MALTLAASALGGPVMASIESAGGDLGAVEPAGTDMPTVGGNPGNQNYSGLTQINKRNLKKLGPTWRTHVSAVAPATDDTGQQTHPIVVDGVIYLDTPQGGVIAVDGATGEAKWKWQPEAPSGGNRRGVSVGEGLVFSMASGGRAGNDQNNDPNAPPGEDVQVVALDQNTGEQVWITSPLGPDGDTLGRDPDPPRATTTASSTSTPTTATAAPSRRSTRATAAWSGPSTAARARHRRHRRQRRHRRRRRHLGAAAGRTASSCALTAGATPWIHGAIDPELGMVYMTFGNVRSCGSSQDGSAAPGRQPVRQLARRGRPQDRRLQVALPVHPSRHLGHGQRARADCSPT